jgi:hypothetical protein
LDRRGNSRRRALLRTGLATCTARDLMKRLLREASLLGLYAEELDSGPPVGTSAPFPRPSRSSRCWTRAAKLILTGRLFELETRAVGAPVHRPVALPVRG